MTWYAFQGLNSGKAIDLAGVQEKIATTWGFHGYASAALAESHPNSVNFITKTEADALIADYTAAVAGNEQPGGSNANILNPANAVKGAAQAGAKAVGAVTDINTFLSRLTSANTWVRVGEFILGALLLLAGALKLTNHSADLKDIAGLAAKVIK